MATTIKTFPATDGWMPVGILNRNGTVAMSKTTDKPLNTRLFAYLDADGNLMLMTNIRGGHMSATGKSHTKSSTYGRLGFIATEEGSPHPKWQGMYFSVNIGVFVQRQPAADKTPRIVARPTGLPTFEDVGDGE